MKKLALLASVGLVAMELVTASARAELLAYDQFTGYTDGDLNGQGQGVGWGANVWTGTANYQANTAVGLTNAALSGVTAGGSANTGTSVGGDVWHGVNRNLPTPLGNGTYYFSYLFRLGSVYPWAGFFAISDSSTETAFFGRWNNNANFAVAYNDGGGYGELYDGALTTNTVLVVVKMEIVSGGGDVARLWVNPADADAVTGVGDVSKTYGNDFNEIKSVGFSVNDRGPADKNFYAFDEIRIGTTPEDMFDPIEPLEPPSGTVITFR